MTESPSPAPSRLGRLVRFLLTVTLTAGVVGAAAFWLGDQVGYQRGHRVGLRGGLADQTADRTLDRDPGISVRLRVPPEEVLDALVDLDGGSLSPAFTDAIVRLYDSLVTETARAYPFPPGQDRRAHEELRTRRMQIAAAHHTPLAAWKAQREGRLGLPTGLVYSPVANDLHTLLKDEACATVRELWILSVSPADSPPVLPGLCGLVLKELIGPWAAELQQLALDKDIAASVTATSTRSRETILDLATASMEIEGTVRHDFESTLFEGWPIEAKDRATLEVRGSGSVKSGFRLMESYAVTVLPDEQLIRVALPRAEILSNTLVPVFSQEKEGWWTALNTDQRNQALRALQAEVEAHAITEGILQDAEEKAQELVAELYSPVTLLPGSRYRVEVVFPDAPPPVE